MYSYNMLVNLMHAGRSIIENTSYTIKKKLNYAIELNTNY